ncbi:MAG: hypothetical protein EAZ85_09395 [Bacteroidetes bacterium]|nr:MAG: hypothetical protein EAZ85_09395 [Bacteroidota bacterium]TAG88615.1 MAG: hypothetical protein EAZ20_08210 [Bacteroidota bacterium]
MAYYCKFFFFFISYNFFSVLSAQQNLFNIPSGDITPEKKFFYQHQLNFYSDKFESKSHIVYGLGKGWDIGFNLINSGFSLQKQHLFKFQEAPVSETPLQPIALFTAQKSFKLHEKFQFNIGTQLGSNINRYSDNLRFAHYSYGVGLLEVFNHWKITFGGYYSNDIIKGRGNDAGFLFGYEIPIVSHKFYLMADFISGNNSQGISAIGFMIPANKKVQFCLGAIVPNINNSKGEYGVVFELNLLGWDYW